MNCFTENCCFKFNYFICGSKENSSKKKISVSENLYVNQIRSNDKMMPLKDFSSYCIFSKDNYFQSKSSFYSLAQSYVTLNNQILVKDIILYRHNPNEQLGLTLSYGITSQFQTNIYIEKIEKGSLAHRQGEFQCGDQIIQINNIKVFNREQAIQLIQGVSLLIFQIIRFQFKQEHSSQRTQLTEDDSGIILGFERNRRRSTSLSCLTRNHLLNRSRRCLSLNDLARKNQSIFSFNDLIQSESLFETTTTDNEKNILKPLPFNYQKDFVRKDSKLIRRRYRERRLKEDNHSLITTTTDEDEFKQGRYWTRKQRREQFQKCKQNKQKDLLKKNHSLKRTTDDFNLLNRIFLRENQQELQEKPYLAVQFSKQTNIERQKLKEFIQQNPVKQSHKTSLSTTTASINSSHYHSSSIII
ncbi:unnamed protein product [Adineta ricciae]|uniref:PDZ domain-containing protein n=1 Tax=Adineta ricciae TaxID=249248 RepID=A0A813W5G7_ADIRI|nr:unnamed protein product [Adineta ricciae]